MAERRRGAFVLFAVLALVLASCATFLIHRYQEGQRWRTEIAGIGSGYLKSAPLEPEWLRRRLGSYGEPFQPIVEIRLGSYAHDPKTRRVREVEAGPWLERFSQISTLKSLDLQSNNTVRDYEIEMLAENPPPALEKLILSRTEIGDPALQALAHISSLKELYISLTLVTEEGIDRLRITRPDLKIVADPLTRRGLGQLHKRQWIDGDRRVVRGFGVPGDMTIIEAERVGRVPNPIWIGFFSPVSDDVVRTLARQRNISSVAFGMPFSAKHINDFAHTGSVKKLTAYAAHLNDGDLVDAIFRIESLEQLLLLSKEKEERLLNEIRERRRDVMLYVEDPEFVGYRFNYRYEPVGAQE